MTEEQNKQLVDSKMLMGGPTTTQGPALSRNVSLFITLSHVPVEIACPFLRSRLTAQLGYVLTFVLALTNYKQRVVGMRPRGG